MLFRNIAIAAIAATTLAACDTNDGPIEEAGEELDNAVGETADAMEDATDEAADAVENP